METLKGIPVSPGVVIGRVFVLDEARRRVPRRVVPPEQVVTEHAKLERALDASVLELTAMKAQTAQELGEEAAKIFAFHVGMLADPSLTRPMHEMIDRDRVTAEY